MVEVGNDIVITISKIYVLVCNQMCSCAMGYTICVYLLFNSSFIDQLVYEFFIKSTPRRGDKFE